MSLIRASQVDKKIIAHLSHGGEIDDSIGKMLVTQLIRESMESEKINRAVRHHGISNEMLVEIYESSIVALLPDPLIRHGGPLLVPSLLFIDEKMLPRILDKWVSSASQIYVIEIKNEFIVQSAVDFIVGLRDAAVARGKTLPWPMENSSTFEQLETGKGAGCLGLIMLLSSLSFWAFVALMDI